MLGVGQAKHEGPARPGPPTPFCSRERDDLRLEGGSAWADLQQLVATNWLLWWFCPKSPCNQSMVVTWSNIKSSRGRQSCRKGRLAWEQYSQGEGEFFGTMFPSSHLFATLHCRVTLFCPEWSYSSVQYSLEYTASWNLDEAVKWLFFREEVSSDSHLDNWLHFILQYCIQYSVQCVVTTV